MSECTAPVQLLGDKQSQAGARLPNVYTRYKVTGRQADGCGLDLLVSIVLGRVPLALIRTALAS